MDNDLPAYTHLINNQALHGNEVTVLESFGKTIKDIVWHLYLGPRRSMSAAEILVTRQAGRDALYLYDVASPTATYRRLPLNSSSHPDKTNFDIV
jgi:hypothetical protein